MRDSLTITAERFNGIKYREVRAEVLHQDQQHLILRVDKDTPIWDVKTSFKAARRWD